MDRMKEKIDSPMGRHIYSQRLGTVEPVFGNLESNKGLKRFTLRGKEKVSAQWLMYCMVHNIEKIATQ
ncbi:transposase, partial [Amphritea pacifica]